VRDKGKEGASPAPANKGADESRLFECACLHAGCLTIESEMSALSERELRRRKKLSQY